MNEITYLASDIMTSPVVTVGPDVTVAEAASLMLERGFGGVPVVGESNEYLGIVTENWFMPQESGYPLMRGTTFSLLGAWMGDPSNIEEAMEKAKGARVGDVLQPGHPVVDAATPVGDIAKHDDQGTRPPHAGPTGWQSSGHGVPPRLPEDLRGVSSRSFNLGNISELPFKYPSP